MFVREREKEREGEGERERGRERLLGETHRGRPQMKRERKTKKSFLPEIILYSRKSIVR